MDDYEPTMLDEVKAFERVSNSKLAELLEDSKTFQDGKRVTDPVDRFLIFTDAIARSFEEYGLEISENDRTIILEKAKSSINIQYKNPTAFILGYLASSGGSELRKDKVKEIIEKSENLRKEYGVEAPDIIRYARFWNKYL